MEKTSQASGLQSLFPDKSSLSHPDFSHLGEEEKLIAKTIDMFVKDQVLPNNKNLEAHDYQTSKELFAAAGELGLLGVEVPEAFDGLEMSKKTSGLVAEKMGYGASFSVAFNIHSGVGTLPYVYFGTEVQKKRYLPKLASGEWVGAYALTEPNAGSDALAASTTAKIDETTGNWIINGEKQWITNAHIANVYVVFAKTEAGITAFIVEREFPGVSIGAEEKKLGIKGSSTATLILDDVKVGPQQVLGAVGKGHHIALNILNLARLKLAFANIGASKQALETAVKYAKERKQFNKALTAFPMIQEKLADMAISIYGAACSAYYTASVLDQLDGSSTEEQLIGSLARYAMDCSINKVYASETLHDCVDETLQIHGGYGYMQDYDVERQYRDARINRLFEGTNEINRLTIAKSFLKRYHQTEQAVVNPADIHGGRKDQFIQFSTYLLQVMMKALPVEKKENMDEKQMYLRVLSDVVKEIYIMKAAYLDAEQGGRGHCFQATESRCNL
ncbi:acyl-CoA dehydrogenase family protein [Virgibacillus halophilus]|uniref:Acyl-CoA dehydrogenase family protein n=1 Tax=Tigheibacillus halophilus TaxID=361280 RepID=A0ABU5C706_9BACI|nr:acyl-CoA dehydrogenase family protein [Virgibacillus halophilus]